MRLDENLIEQVRRNADVYSTTTPVIIRYSDENGNFLYDHVGALKTTIYYKVSA
jgi:hypothetical protein